MSMLLSTQIIGGCKTLQKTDFVVLPPMPERETLKPITSVSDYADAIVYYETLVQKWEAWGATVKEIIGESE